MFIRLVVVDNGYNDGCDNDDGCDDHDCCDNDAGVVVHVYEVRS